MRLMDGCPLRIKDIDFERKQIIIREGKGNKDRCVPLPQKIIPKLKAQFTTARCKNKLRMRFAEVEFGRRSSIKFHCSSINP